MSQVGITVGHNTFGFGMTTDQTTKIQDLKFKEQKMEIAANMAVLQRRIDNPEASSVAGRTTLPSGEGGVEGLNDLTGKVASDLQMNAMEQGKAGVSDAQAAANSSITQMAQATNIQMAATNATAIISMIAKFAETVSKKVKGTGDSSNQMA